MKQISIIGTMLFVLIALTSCGNNELTREKAQELLLSANSNKELTKNVVPLRKKADDMNQLGYLDYDYSETRRSYRLSNFRLRDKAKKYLVSEKKRKDGKPIYTFRIGKEEFIEVTGLISDENSNSATVEYTKKFSYNNMGKSLFGFYDKTENLKAKLIRYDDGWRIQN